jgi:hypothetical protein
MVWTRGAAALFASLIVMACGPRVAPGAHSSPVSSPTRASAPRTSEPTPTPTPQPVVASVSCSGGPAAAMAVIAGQFLYDVGDPVNPRLICHASDTIIHMIDGPAIAFTTVVAGQVVIVRRDLTTGSETQIAQLRSNPGAAITAWASDGSLEVYATAVPGANGRWLEQIHLWKSGADHILYTYDAGPGGFAGRWSAHFILEFSPDHAYLAISDTNYSPQNYNVRIFSVGDLSQKAVTGTQGLAAGGGTWVANDHFVWAAGSGTLMHWTPADGSTVLRSERWFMPTSSPDGRWLAGTLLADQVNPRVLIVPVGAGRTYTTGPGSSPGFVTGTVVWYAEEGPDTSGTVTCVEPCDHPTVPNGTVRAFDVRNGTDQIVRFRPGEAPKTAEGYVVCCAARG